MNKIYFCPNWDLSSEEMASNYIYQTPNNSGVWNNIQVTYDVDDADYLIIEDNCFDNDLLKRFRPDQRLYFSREALDSTSHLNYPSGQFLRFSFWDGSGYLYTKWRYPNTGLNMSYDELMDEKGPITKNKMISCVQSDKEMTPIHIERKKFIKRYADTHPIDVYGSIECANKALENNCKKNALDEYRYTLAFDNQVSIEDFFGTQFTDALLRWTVPIYGGGACLEDYFPENSYIEIDPRDINDIDKVVNIISESDYESRLDDIKEARNLIMNEYNLWPTVEGLIDG
jgi:hypothetical protein